MRGENGSCRRWCGTGLLCRPNGPVGQCTAGGSPRCVEHDADAGAGRSTQKRFLHPVFPNARRLPASLLQVYTHCTGHESSSHSRENNATRVTMSSLLQHFAWFVCVLSTITGQPCREGKAPSVHTDGVHHRIADDRRRRRTSIAIEIGSRTPKSTAPDRELLAW